MTKLPMVGLVVLALLVTCQIALMGQSPRAGWVNANQDSTIYVDEIKIFNSSEISSYYKPSDDEKFYFRYNLADREEPSSNNGAYGLLAEYGATVGQVRAQLDQWTSFKKEVESKKKTDVQINKFLSDSWITSLQAIRNYYLLLLEYAKSQKPDIYKSYLENYSLRLAFSTTEREANRALNTYSAMVDDLIKILNSQGKAARVDGNYLFIGNSGTTFRQPFYDEQYEKRYRAISAEFTLTKAILSKSATKHVFKIIRPADSRFGTDTRKADLFLGISQLVNPDAHEILKRVSNPTEYTRYARDTSFSSLIGDFNTVIHESCHVVNATGDYEFFDSYFVSATIQIPVRRTKVFNSRELNKVIPENYKKEIFRYDTYIGNSDDNGSKVEGIYGMLDEFTAYYHGGKMDWAMKTNAEQLHKLYPEYDFSKCASNTDNAFYEFTIFMGWYLEFARKNYPDQYKHIVNDTAFKVAYTLLDTHFKKQVEERPGSQLSAPYMIVYKEKRVVLDILRIPGCNDENYKSYLK